MSILEVDKTTRKVAFACHWRGVLVGEGLAYDTY
jgi:hypothetical protein